MLGVSPKNIYEGSAAPSREEALVIRSYFSEVVKLNPKGLNVLTKKINETRVAFGESKLTFASDKKAKTKVTKTTKIKATKVEAEDEKPLFFEEKPRVFDREDFAAFKAVRERFKFFQGKGYAKLIDQIDSPPFLDSAEYTVLLEEILDEVYGFTIQNAQKANIGKVISVVLNPKKITTSQSLKVSGMALDVVEKLAENKNIKTIFKSHGYIFEPSETIELLKIAKKHMYAVSAVKFLHQYPSSWLDLSKAIIKQLPKIMGEEEAAKVSGKGATIASGEGKTVRTRLNRTYETLWESGAQSKMTNVLRAYGHKALDAIQRTITEIDYYPIRDKLLKSFSKHVNKKFSSHEGNFSFNCKNSPFFKIDKFEQLSERAFNILTDLRRENKVLLSPDARDAKRLGLMFSRLINPLAVINSSIQMRGDEKIFFEALKKDYKFMALYKAATYKGKRYNLDFDGVVEFLSSPKNVREASSVLIPLMNEDPNIRVALLKKINQSIVRSGEDLADVDASSFTQLFFKMVPRLRLLKVSNPDDDKGKVIEASSGSSSGSDNPSEKISKPANPEQVKKLGELLLEVIGERVPAALPNVIDNLNNRYENAKAGNAPTKIIFEVVKIPVVNEARVKNS